MDLGHGRRITQPGTTCTTTHSAAIIVFVFVVIIFIIVTRTLLIVVDKCEDWQRRMTLIALNTPPLTIVREVSHLFEISNVSSRCLVLLLVLVLLLLVPVLLL